MIDLGNERTTTQLFDSNMSSQETFITIKASMKALRAVKFSIEQILVNGDRVQEMKIKQKNKKKNKENKGPTQWIRESVLTRLLSFCNQSQP